MNLIENEDILIEQYLVSEITSVHEFVDLTDKRWDKTERIYEGDPLTIDSVFIRNDTNFMTSRRDQQLIYELSAIKFGYHNKY